MPPGAFTYVVAPRPTATARTRSWPRTDGSMSSAELRVTRKGKPEELTHEPEPALDEADDVVERAAQVAGDASRRRRRRRSQPRQALEALVEPRPCVGREAQVHDAHVARLADERQRQPLDRTARTRHLGPMDTTAARELHAVVDDELVDLVEEAEIARIRQEVRLHDRDALRRT